MNRSQRRKKFSKQDLEERKLIERLWDGRMDVLMKLKQLRQFKNHMIYLRWLDRNGIRGVRIIEFFNEQHRDETAGVLRGVGYMKRAIMNERYSNDPLTIKDLK